MSRVVLAFPHDDRDARIINRGLKVCGCELGAIFLTVAIVAVVVCLTNGWRAAWWVVALIIMGSTLAGKILGIVLAEWRFRAALDRLT